MKHVWGKPRNAAAWNLIVAKQRVVVRTAIAVKMAGAPAAILIQKSANAVKATKAQSQNALNACLKRNDK